MRPDCAAGDPLISIIVPTFNSAGTLADALESAAGQSFRGFELIVSDGASGDATLAMAQEWSSRVPSLRVDSRPDRGVYDAINRGVEMSRGRWFMVLGSDDRLHAPDTLARLAAALGECADEVEWVYGDVIMMGENSCGVPPGGRFAGPMPLRRMIKANICQQAIVYRRSLFAALGGFDLGYRIYADWAFNLRAAFRGPGRWLDLVVADYATSGMSGQSIDTRFIEDRPELVRRELLARPRRVDLWPVQRQLLSDANRQLRGRRWRNGLALVASYLRLLGLRLPVVLGRTGVHSG